MEKKVVKKPYTKPRFEFIEFSLASNIAATCTYTGNHADGDTCEYDDNGWFRFSTKNGDCIEKDDDPSFCYHVPTSETSVFTS